MCLKSSHKPDILDELELLSEPDRDSIRLRFSGCFEDETVHWDATIYTPEAWSEAFRLPLPAHNIIEIGTKGENGMRLNLCIKVKTIDRPTIRKAVMMVRQYKRLHQGRHEYG
mgnify:CR=1 FL=1